MATNEKATIVDLVDGLPRLRVFDEEISSYEDKYFVSTIPIAEKNTYLGIEVETENILFWNPDVAPYWKMTEDGSLRNNGREFISVPIKAFRVENALTTLFTKQLNRDIDFSERTSIHVHMNVRTMTLEQLKTMVLLYLVFERALFRYVHPDRYNNIFCVPLNETAFGEKLLSLFHTDLLQFSWLKYTALNLCPIFEKGTIEFRHLHGTKDIKEIVNWINLILCLKKAALKNSSEYLWEKVRTLNTSSEYHSFANEIFGDFASNLDMKSIAEDMSSCVTYVKTYCFQNPWKQELISNISKKSPLYGFSNQARQNSLEELRMEVRLRDPQQGVTRTTGQRRVAPAPSVWFSNPEVQPSPWVPTSVSVGVPIPEEDIRFDNSEEPTQLTHEAIRRLVQEQMADLDFREQQFNAQVAVPATVVRVPTRR